MLLFGRRSVALNFYLCVPRDNSIEARHRRLVALLTMAVATAVASTSLAEAESSNGNDKTRSQRVNLPLFNERLIEEVEKYPVLYDQSQRNCMDNDERVKIWDDIARAVDPAVKGEFAKKRWLQIRDRYRKELKVALRDNFANPPKWVYFPRLKWLDPHLKDTNKLLNPTVESCGSGKQNCDVIQELYNGVKSETDLSDYYDDSFGCKYDPSLSSTMAMLENVFAQTASESCESGDQTAEPGCSPDSGTVSNSDEGDGKGSDVMGDELSRDKSFDCADIDGVTPECGGEQRALSEEASTSISYRKMPSLQYTKSKFHPYRQCSSAQGRLSKQNVDGFVQAYRNVCPEPHSHGSAAESFVDLINDEDILFSRIVAIRLKKLMPKDRRSIRLKILEIFDTKDEEIEASNTTAT
uniref:MADF domain-containing protein n=1 Tax=Steinernema glaseri TaxID=37863 RepID=A0A1I8A911_9BILA